MINDNYWIWLQMCLGAGAHFKEIIDDFGSIEKLYNSNILERRMSPLLTPKQADALEQHTVNEAEEIIYTCNQNNWQIISFEDAQYPQRLREISNPPAVLYVDGNLPNVDNIVCIGIVGTRKASSYATKVAHTMAKGISLCGAVAVSGGAIGVDTAAHSGALSVNAKTIAVLGNGFGADYLKSNKSLREAIRKNGALITEYPPFTPANKTTFPLRNRIISGLSLGVLVVEAGIKSGSLITAKHAMEQNRDVYTIPCSIYDYDYTGCNRLIKDGVQVVVDCEMLVERYASQYQSLDLSRAKTNRELMENGYVKSANAPKPKQVKFDSIVEDRAINVEKQSKAMELNGNEKIIYNTLNENLIGIDAIIDNSGLASKDALTALTMLEMKGLIESASGKRYKIK